MINLPEATYLAKPFYSKIKCEPTWKWPLREEPSDWFNIEDLANRAQLSPRYFSAKFKEIIGVNVSEYEIQSRLKRAEFLLHYGGLTVSETADALGYKEVYFFSKQFKKHFGNNPSAIR